MTAIDDLEVATTAAAEEIVTRYNGVVTAVDASALAALCASIYNHSTLRAKRIDPRTGALQVR